MQLAHFDGSTDPATHVVLYDPAAHVANEHTEHVMLFRYVLTAHEKLQPDVNV